MKKKTSVILIIAILMVFAIIAVFTILIMKNKQENNQEPIVDFASTTIEQRTVWNNFLNSNAYLSQVEAIPYISKTDMIKLAVTSDNIETERIITAEIEQNPSLSMGDGYKKSINNINEYMNNLLGEQNIQYNFVDAYCEENNYLIIGEEYVYFTKIELPEKIYIAVTYQIENNNYEVQIYEYDVTEENREKLNKMLETGEINKEITIANRYTLTGQIENNNIKIETKTTF